MERPLALLSLGGTALLSGLFAIACVTATVPRPHARPGQQVRLPSHGVVRVAVLAGMFVTCALAISSIAGC